MSILIEPAPKRRMTRSVTVFATAGLMVAFMAGCGSSSDDSSSTTTTTEATTTTEPPPELTDVETTFASEATPDQATQDADVMTKRLEAAGYEGSVATVNDASTGLTVGVAGVDSADEAGAIVEQLAVNGKLYFRPVLEGPIAPAADETQSTETTTTTTTDPSTASTVPATPIETTSPDQDQPDGTSVLRQLDLDLAVISRWEVGPEEVDATAIDEANQTTYQSSEAVQVVMKEGSPGIDQFNALAEACFNKAATCPTGVYSVVFDSVVTTVSSVRPDDSTFKPFSTTGVIIWSPDWTADQAKVTTAIIKVGEMPVALTVA